MKDGGGSAGFSERQAAGKIPLWQEQKIRDCHFSYPLLPEIYFHPSVDGLADTISCRYFWSQFAIGFHFDQIAGVAKSC